MNLLEAIEKAKKLSHEYSEFGEYVYLYELDGKYGFSFEHKHNVLCIAFKGNIVEISDNISDSVSNQ